MARKKSDFEIPMSWPVRDPASYCPITRLVPYDRNPKTHPPAQIAMLASLLTRFGPDQPIVVDENWIILKGHGRRLAAIEAGLEVFTFVQRGGLSEAEKIAMRIQDNQVPLLGGWNAEIIRGEMNSLKMYGYDLVGLGFGEKQLVEFETTPGPPAGFQQFDESIPTAFHCPCGCNYRWSGNPMAGADPDEVKKAKAKKGKK